MIELSAASIALPQVHLEMQLEGHYASYSISQIKKWYYFSMLLNQIMKYVFYINAECTSVLLLGKQENMLEA